MTEEARDGIRRERKESEGKGRELTGGISGDKGENAMERQWGKRPYESARDFWKENSPKLKRKEKKAWKGERR